MTTPHCRPVACLFATAFFSVLVGCSHDGKPGPLAPEFATLPRTQKEMAADPLSGVDQPGALYRNSRVDSAPQNNADPDVKGLSKIVRENVTAPGAGRADVPDGATTEPSILTMGSTRPTTTPGVSTGQYLTVGGVVAEVNGTPIYANQVINEDLLRLLAARAKDLDEPHFRAVATKEITKQMVALRDLQLEYARAERNLDQKDKELADVLTEEWKKKQITAAGGSVELARKLARDRGLDFDQMLQDQYRLVMSQIYYQKKVYPRIVVNAADMREYYDHNRDREFTNRGSAQFRLIKIDVRKHDGHDAATKLAEELRNRIVKAGEKFEAVARSVNDDPRLLRSGGEVGRIDEGSFAIEPVEKAVWATPDGQVTPVIDTGDALYLALVVEKHPGRGVIPFEDEAVQIKITEALKAIQFREAREKAVAQLVADAVIRSDKDMLNIAVEMAMQNYSRWSAK